MAQVMDSQMQINRKGEARMRLTDRELRAMNSCRVRETHHSNRVSAMVVSSAFHAPYPAGIDEV